MTAASSRFCGGAAAASSVCAAMQEAEHSFLRHVIPLRVHGPGPMTVLYRHAFIHQEHLIHRVLGALEAVPLPALPRMLLAEGFQRMLEGQIPQRDIRALFEEAESEAHRVILHAEFHADVARRQKDAHIYAAIKGDPLTRLLAYELRAACGYYAQMMALSSRPEEGAAALLRTLIAADIRTDPFLLDVMLKFDSLRRDLTTGERLEPCAPYVEEFVKECLLVERDAFGRFRFDARGDNRHLVHGIKINDITKTPKGFSVVLDPVLQQYGNFHLERKVVHQGRWVEYRLSCAKESHRVDPQLPLLETISANIQGEDNSGADNTVAGDATSPLEFIVRYDDPMCRRHKETSREKDAEKDHVEVFELAVEDTSRTFWERWFMDR
ncbi:hypothetical protein DQ04_00391070 [Trypanosoma grayi]|uniref:hypothetical protein n=1 Tax=Trypanosoma grayi TaxID=71804 RepID=UPI0004F4690A|nr:hypothetical protein DQ04_00391070 [Trypanosoma grayi]KEG14585.1 hypothetical protein DQ04_00391070 [Trypanosoma grayi]